MSGERRRKKEYEKYQGLKEELENVESGDQSSSNDGSRTRSCES